MLYFMILLLGIVIYKIAVKIQWEEYLRKRKKENKERWTKKRKPHGNRVQKHNKPPKRKKL